MTPLFLSSLAQAGPALYGVRPAVLDARDAFPAPTPLTVSGAGLAEGTVLELAQPTGAQPLRLSVVAHDDATGEVMLPAGLTVGRYDLRLVGVDGAGRCLPEALQVVAPRCDDTGIVYTLGSATLDEPSRERLLEAARCRLREGAEELYVLAHAAPGEGVGPTLPVSAPRFGYDPELARARAEGAAAALAELGLPLTPIALMRPLPDRVVGSTAGSVRLIARLRGEPGPVPCPLDGGAEAASCMLSSGSAAVLLVPGQDDALSTLGHAWSETNVAVEWAAPLETPQGLALAVPADAPPPRVHALHGCARAPRRASPGPAAPEPRGWTWMALAGGGIVGTLDAREGLRAGLWTDLRIGLERGPFIGVGGHLHDRPDPPADDDSDDPIEARPGGSVLMLGWETPLPDREPAYAWVGPWIGEPAVAGAFGVPLLEAMEGRLRPVLELRGAFGWSPEAPWALGLGLSLSWREVQPFTRREEP